MFPIVMNAVKENLVLLYMPLIVHLWRQTRMLCYHCWPQYFHEHDTFFFPIIKDSFCGKQKVRWSFKPSSTLHGSLRWLVVDISILLLLSSTSVVTDFAYNQPQTILYSKILSIFLCLQYFSLYYYVCFRILLLFSFVHTSSSTALSDIEISRSVLLSFVVLFAALAFKVR